VTIKNARQHLQAGATAVGVGISLFGAKAVSSEDWNTVRKNVETFIHRCMAA
jgi:2-keto-3-deoxy-6-phosphogluconate aldolase